jgi:hypothetical protein
MKKELQEELFAIEPKWFNRSNMQVSLMCFGFEVGDGWFVLLRELLHQIKKSNPPEDFEVVQVKEKWGGLRFYTHNENDEILGAIHLAETLSDLFCEECGERGKVGGKGWVQTLCRECRDAKTGGGN